MEETPKLQLSKFSLWARSCPQAARRPDSPRSRGFISTYPRGHFKRGSGGGFWASYHTSAQGSLKLLGKPPWKSMTSFALGDVMQSPSSPSGSLKRADKSEMFNMANNMGMNVDRVITLWRTSCTTSSTLKGRGRNPLEVLVYLAEERVRPFYDINMGGHSWYHKKRA